MINQQMKHFLHFNNLSAIFLMNPKYIKNIYCFVDKSLSRIKNFKNQININVDIYFSSTI